MSSGVENISLLIGCCSTLAACSVQSELSFSVAFSAIYLHHPFFTNQLDVKAPVST